jgi:hypothetical protein
MTKYVTIVFAVLALGSAALSQPAIGTAFRYDGWLFIGSQPVTSVCDFRFRLFASQTGGSQLAAQQVRTEVRVVAGNYTVNDLDFGDQFSTGMPRWIEIWVRNPAGIGPYVRQTPRRALLPGPYALLGSAGGVSTILGGTGIEVTNGEGPSATVSLLNQGISTGHIGNAQVTTAKLADDAVDGSKLAANAVATVNVLDASITNTKLAPGIAPNKIAGFPNDATRYLRGDGMWTTPSGAVYQPGSGITISSDIISVANSGVMNSHLAGNISPSKLSGYPADSSRYLRGDGQWTTPPLGTYSAGSGIAISGNTISVASASIGWSHLAQDPSSLSKVSGGVMGSNGTVIGIGGGVNNDISFLVNTNVGYAITGSSNASSGGIGVRGISNGTNGRGIYGVVSSSSSSGAGVYGEKSGTSGHGGYFTGGAGSKSTTAYSSGDALFGEATSSTGPAWGVRGETASTSTTAYGVYGSAPATAYAGYFAGRVHVQGQLSKAGGSFKIDHPLDPTNKFLLHSFVESPDMMNIYNGNAVTNEHGEALIQLPTYFEALNHEFRYQLTVIGQFAQAIVSEEVRDNHFAIRTNIPHVKVSWQVTGIRKDRWAEAHRIPVEVEKSFEDRGRYLHPEVFGLPLNQAVGFIPEKVTPH